MMTILDTIFDARRLRVRDARERCDMRLLRESAEQARRDREPNRLANALSNRTRINVIAEFKKASPSKGVINASLDPGETAAKYERGGAAAISVLTEEDFFRGSLDDLRQVRDVVSVPVLRKDFFFDEFQIYEAASAGADAILLIVAMLDPKRLVDLQATAHRLGIDALVEVHTAEEMQVATEIGARLIGVNNRNLHTFEVSLDVSRELAALAPNDAVLVSESGLRTCRDLLDLKRDGYSGFLIGETLMRSGDPTEALRQLTHVTEVKICGITSTEDAMVAVESGADALGFNFYQKSPRYVAPNVVAEMAKQLPRHVRRVGVFVNEDAGRVADIARSCRLDAIQLHGDESKDYVAEIRKLTKCEIIKAVRVKDGDAVRDIDHADAILLDAYSSQAYGGTGETFDWSVARRAAEAGAKVYLAGGLSAANVRRAIESVRPFAVDACSALESAPGRKDREKVRQFIEEAKQA